MFEKQLWKSTKTISDLFFFFFKEFLGQEEAALLASESPDVEFEGMGDYEESIYADWRQPKGKGDAGESDVTRVPLQ